MKIAYLGCKGLPSKSGTERVVEAVTSRLSGRHAITVYCDARYTPKGTQIDGVRLVRIPTIRGKHIQPVSLFLFSALHALFSRYDLIHLQGTDACFTLPLLRLKYAVVSTSHGVPGRVSRLKWSKADRFFIRLMEYPFVYLSNFPTSVSCPDAEYLIARFKRNVVYIPNGVGHDVLPDEQKAGHELARLGLEPGKYLLFAAGRIDPTKGCHLVLEALNTMAESPRLAIVGDLEQVPSYGQRLREMARKDRVVFIPPIADQALLFGMIRQARLFLFPSLAEGMSMMLLEAASLQVPVVCSDIAENRSTMQDNVLYFRSGDAADLADKIRWALDRPAEMASLAHRASAYVNDCLTWDNIAGQYEQLYRACAKAQ